MGKEKASSKKSNKKFFVLVINEKSFVNLTSIVKIYLAMPVKEMTSFS